MFYTFKKIFTSKKTKHITIEEMEAKKREMEAQLELLIAVEKKLKNKQESQLQTNN